MDRKLDFACTVIIDVQVQLGGKLAWLYDLHFVDKLTATRRQFAEMPVGTRQGHSGWFRKPERREGKVFHRNVRFPEVKFISFLKVASWSYEPANDPLGDWKSITSLLIFIRCDPPSL